MSSSSSSKHLSLKQIPGDYGVPFFGAIKDRLDYFYNQGKDEFFTTRIEKYNSTVIRTNMPPGPFIAKNPRVVALLDAISFPVLFDTSKVEKRNVLDGTFFPSVSFTGGYRVCAYLDPSEHDHTSLKAFFLSILSSKHENFIPVFKTCLSQLFIDIEDQITTQKKASFNTLSDAMCFSFLFKLFCDKDPLNTDIGSKGSGIFDKWLALQLAPLVSLVLPKFLKFLDDFLLHTFPFPFFLVKSDYKKLYDAFNEHACSVLDKAANFGIQKDEACHNLVFLAGFNAYGGMKALFPNLIKWVALAGEKLHSQLAHEIRTVVKNEGGVVTLQALDKMTLTKSVVYEALRIEPPVPFQYGKAKEDIVVHSHDAAFEIKKGEMIFGYQTFATNDAKVFENPNEFLGHRFVGEGEKLLKYVYWSNNRETENPTVENKQCPAKDLVLILARVMLVELFLRYETFTVEIETGIGLASSVTFTSLTKAKAT